MQVLDATLQLILKTDEQLSINSWFFTVNGITSNMRLQIFNLIHLNKNAFFKVLFSETFKITSASVSFYSSQNR